MKQTVVNMGMSRSSNGTVELRIEDQHSGDRILNISMSLEELGLLITGLHGVKGEADVYPANIAMKREVREVYCNRTDSYDKDDQRIIVQSDFLTNPELDGWQLHNDGCDTQQRGDRHKYTVKRYVPVENPLEVERYY